MKPTTLALILCLLTTASVLLVVFQSNSYSTPANGQTLLLTSHQTSTSVVDNPLDVKQPKVELVFALDTTASMGGLILAAKEKIWSIASTMAAAKPAPDIKIGIVAYRDRGDEYVTKVINLTNDLDSVYAQLLDLTAAGGGDGPESVNAALFDAVHAVSWSQDAAAYKAIFLVGDAPGHNDYPNDTPFQSSLQSARQNGIVVNTIQAGEIPETTLAWQQIASLGRGASFQVGLQGSAVAVATPFDQAIADASRQLDETRVYFGDQQALAKSDGIKKTREKIYRDSSTASLARRAKYNSSESAKKNSLQGNDLINEIIENGLEPESLPVEELPLSMQAMTSEEQAAFIQQKISTRNQIKNDIKELSKKREAFIQQKVGEITDLDNSLDAQLSATLQKQAKAKGISMAETEISY